MTVGVTLLNKELTKGQAEPQAGLNRRSAHALLRAGCERGLDLLGSLGDHGPRAGYTPIGPGLSRAWLEFEG